MMYEDSTYKDSSIHTLISLELKEKLEEILTAYLLIHSEYRFDSYKSLINFTSEYNFKFMKQHSRFILTIIFNNNGELSSIVFAGVLGINGQTAIRIATTDDKTPIEVLEAAKSHLI